VVGEVDGIPSDLVVADFDGHPRPDLAVAVNRGVFERGGAQLVLNRRPDFIFGPLVLGGVAPYSIGAGDLDRDGDRDAVEPNTASDDLTVFSNSRPGALEATTVLPAAYLPRGIAVADFNRDGLADVATSSTDQANCACPGALRVFYRRPDNTGFDPPVAVPPASQSDSFAPLEALAAADLNHDGLLDIVGADEGANRLVVSYRRHDNGGFDPVRAGLDVADGPIDVAAGDLNGDGRTDLATANILGTHVAVLLQRSDGSGFLPAEYFDVGGGSGHVVIADLDGDRRQDVAVSVLDTGKVAVILRRRNDHGFRPPRLFDAGNVPLALGAADLDGDRDTDLVVGNRDSHEIRLLVNGARRPRG
jgi:FG-GAP-like repeat